MTLESPHSKIAELRLRLTIAGFNEIELTESEDGQLINYRMRQPVVPNPGVAYNDDYSAVTEIMKEAGYPVGLEELAMNFNGVWLDGAFLTRPFAVMCAEWEQAAPVD